MSLRNPWSNAMQLEIDGSDGADDEEEEETQPEHQQRVVRSQRNLKPASPPPSSLGFSKNLDREFSPPFRHLWPSFSNLNHVQSACFSMCAETDNNLVVAAPTVSLYARTNYVIG